MGNVNQLIGSIRRSRYQITCIIISRNAADSIVDLGLMWQCVMNVGKAITELKRPNLIF